MKQTTADILDNTDALTQRMDYQMFTAEQNARLWGGEDGWRPGDPIHREPPGRDTPRMVDERHLQYVRPIIEELELDQFHLGPNQVYVDLYCKDCEVAWGWGSGWDGDTEVCWWCGKQVITFTGKPTTAARAADAWRVYAGTGETLTAESFNMTNRLDEFRASLLRVTERINNIETRIDRNAAFLQRHMQAEQRAYVEWSPDPAEGIMQQYIEADIERTREIFRGRELDFVIMDEASENDTIAPALDRTPEDE